MKIEQNNLIDLSIFTGNIRDESLFDKNKNLLYFLEKNKDVLNSTDYQTYIVDEVEEFELYAKFFQTILKKLTNFDSIIAMSRAIITEPNMSNDYHGHRLFKNFSIYPDYICCYYIQNEKNSGHLSIPIYVNGKNYCRCLEFRTGDFIFFPGFLDHFVQINLSDKNRVVQTISYKFIDRDVFGKMHDLDRIMEREY